MRNIGSSVGISILEAVLVRNTSTIHADLVRHVTPDNPNLALFAPRGWSLATRQGMAFVDAQVTNQAAMVSYVDCFKLMLDIALVVMPLVLLMRPPRGAPAKGEVHAVE